MDARRLAKYELLEEVGQGGMAVVFRGMDTSLNREVAVKVLHPHLAGQLESRQRLQREAHAVAKLHHENILEIFDYSGPDSDESYIVTEFIHGKTLKAFVGEHPLVHPEIAAMIASEVARALEHAHGLGVIHRDIKPENVMVRDDGVVKLMDFGIAQIVDKERMTVTGQLMGSPAYMAPEHVDGKPLDFRTDVFALGILTYQLATGQLPFRGKNPHEVLKRIADCSYTPARQVSPRISARLARVIARALQREPGDRYPNVTPMRAELLEDLAEVGVDDARRELAAFFTDPRGYEDAFAKRLLPALIAAGKLHYAAGRTARALELWERGLFLAPKHDELNALVDGIAKRSRMRRAAFWIAGAVALVVAGGWTWSRIREMVSQPVTASTTSSPSPTLVAAPPPLPAAPSPRAAVPPPSPRAISRIRPVSEAPPPSPAEIVAASRSVEIVPTPKAVRVILDGKDLGEWGPSLQHVSLSPGPHQLELTNPACYPKQLALRGEDAPAKITARLKWKPATLEVRSTPQTADLLIDGAVAGRTGQAMPIPIPEHSLDGRRAIKVRVSAEGRDSVELSANVRANESTVIEAALPVSKASP